MKESHVVRSYWGTFRTCPEVVGAMYLFSLMFVAPINEQYLYKRFSIHYGLNYSVKGSVDHCHQINISALEIKVSDKTSKLMVWHNIAQLVPAMMVMMYVGPLSDRLGRKTALMWNNFLFILALGLTLAIIIFDLNVYLTLISQLLYGLGGYYTCYVMALYAYVSDTTTGNGRSFRLAVIDLIVLMSVTASNFGGGFFLEKFGFAWSYVLALACATTCLVYTLGVLKESLHFSCKPMHQSSCLAEPLQIWRFLRKSRDSRWMLFLLTVTNGFINLLSPSTVMPILLLFLINHPLCLSPSKVGLYRGVYFLAVGIGGAAGVKFLPKLVGNVGAMFVSLLSMAGGLVLLSFTTRMEMAFIAVAASVFTFVVGPLVCGRASSLCSANEQGSFWAFLMIIQEVFMLCGNYMLQGCYRFFMRRGKPGGVFAFAAVWTAFPAILLLVYGLKSSSSKPVELVDVPADSDESTPKSESDHEEADPLLS